MVYQWISIHAPTKGATAAVGKQSGGIIDFNPRSHEGSDGAEKHQAVWKRHFNPRSHEGSDVPGQAHCVSQGYFNPRSHEGSD